MGILPWLLTSLSLLFPSLVAQGPPTPENINITGTSFLEHEAPISGFAGQSFLQENIPFIDIPNLNIQAVFYYRFSSLQRHLRYTVAGTGYILTEFVQPVGYAQALNTIDAAAGHQIDETRWLRSKFYNDDYIQVYTRGPGNTTQYTHWILDAMYRRSQVDGDPQFMNEQLSDMTRLWDYWDPVYDQDVGMYYFTPNFDAQEYSLPGYVVAPDGGQLQLDGPDTYRPDHNAYMVANARAIAQVAAQSGNTNIASNFTQIADNLESAMYTYLWDPIQEFFVDVIRPNNPNLTRINGREEVGLYPYRFGIGLSPSYSSASVQQLFDLEGFLDTYGPTTLEIRNQYFAAAKPSSYCCFWNGQSWPFSTAHTLKSLAAIYRSGNTSLTAEQYVQYVDMYATTQHKDGSPYVAESHYPDVDSWSADSSNHSEHYDHSTNNDDVITGLLGIIPRSDDILEVSPIIPGNWTYFAIENLSYHGHLVTVLYDEDGSRYKNGTGLFIFVDGTKIYNGNGTSAQVSIPPPVALSTEIPVNIAANPNGLGSFPQVEATYTYHTDDPYKTIDGYLFYDSIPDNRWTNYQSPNPNDTLTVTFARPRTISSVTLALYSDVARGGGVDVPLRLEIYGDQGLISNVSGMKFLPNDKNMFAFGEVETRFVAVNMFNKPSVFVGVCELEVWVPPSASRTLYAVDALLTSASVVQDSASNATRNGAVVGGLGSGSVLAFSGIVGNGGKANLELRYRNEGTAEVEIGVVVNQVVQKETFTLVGTAEGYASTDTEVQLSGGRNFVSLIGGGAGVWLESLDVVDG